MFVFLVMPCSKFLIDPQTDLSNPDLCDETFIQRPKTAQLSTRVIQISKMMILYYKPSSAFLPPVFAF